MSGAAAQKAKDERERLGAAGAGKPKAKAGVPPPSRYSFQLRQTGHSSDRTQRSLPHFIVFGNALPFLLTGKRCESPITQLFEAA